MRDTTRRAVAVLAVTVASLTALAPAASAADRTFCIYANDWTIICIDDLGT